MGLYSKSVGPEGRGRRAGKRAERRRIQAELYDAHRLTPEERWALMDVAPSSEADRTGLSLFPGIYDLAQHPSEMSEAAARSARFLRGVRLDLPRGYTADNLNQLIEDGVGELHRVATLCGAILVGRNYGLYDNRVARRGVRHPQSHLIPPGFVLSAFVDSIISVASLNTELTAQINEGLTSYRGMETPNKLKDQEPRQFIYGTLRGKTNPLLYLADVDLRFV